MASDIKELCKMLDVRGIPYVEMVNGHEIRWIDGNMEWMYSEQLNVGREARVCVYNVGPVDAMRMMDGVRNSG